MYVGGAGRKGGDSDDVSLFWEKIRKQSRHSLRRTKVFTKQTCHNSFTALRNLVFLTGL